jgi:adenosylhomocysteine nucleosidase
LILVAWGAGFAEPTGPVTAVLVAFDPEIAPLKAEVQNRQEETVCGIPFVMGDLKGRRIVLARTGVGKVNAAMTATLAISRFTPHEVIFCGIAGALNPKLRPADVIIGETVVQHDYGFVDASGFRRDPTTHPVTGNPNPLFFPSDKRLLSLAEGLAGRVRIERPTGATAEERTAQVMTGTIVTGDTFVASSAKKKELIEALHGDAVEMEGAAVAQVCYQHGVSFIVIRSVSDSADETANADLAQFCKVAARNAAEFAMALAGALAAEQENAGAR